MSAESPEDPEKFYPCPGKITKWVAPGGANVRLDTHAYGGYTVPMHYDFMIGKLIVWGEDRRQGYYPYAQGFERILY